MGIDETIAKLTAIKDEADKSIKELRDKVFTSWEKTVNEEAAEITKKHEELAPVAEGFEKQLNETCDKIYDGTNKVFTEEIDEAVKNWRIF